MVRQGALAFVIVALAACTQNVDDPAVFTAGPNSTSNSAGSSTTDGDGNEVSTGVVDGGATTTTTTGSADTTGADTTPPADTGNTGNCGNGMIDMGEQCDGADLQGFNCASLGLNGGTLACDPMMCTFDTSMCSSTTGGTSG